MTDLPKCSKCGAEKPSGDFYRKASSPTGLQPQCKECSRESNRAWRKENPERRRELDKRYYDRRGLSTHRKRKYGVTDEQVDSLMSAQGGACAICEVNPAEHLDHDHATGAVGGILCAPCNKGLGHFRDNSTLLRKAADYVDRVRPLA